MRLQFQGDEAESFNPPIVQGDTIFFGSSDGNFYALNSGNGYMRWIFQTKNQINSAAFADDETVYFGSNDGSVYAVDIESGDERWSFPTGNTVQSLVLRYQDHVIFTSDTGSTFFLSPEGELQHRLPNDIWSHHTFQVYDGIVYWAPLGNGFGAYDIENRRFLWEFDVRRDAPLRAAIWYSFPAIDEDRVYFASNFLTGGPGGLQSQLSYYAVDRLTGNTIWRKRTPFEWSRRLPRNQDTAFFDHVPLLDYMAPSLYGDLVIFTSGDRTVRAFDRDSGEEGLGAELRLSHVQRAHRGPAIASTSGCRALRRIPELWKSFRGSWPSTPRTVSSSGRWSWRAQS